MVPKIALTLLCLVSGALVASADPANVLVGDLTFVRPETWKWEAVPENRAVLTQFVVPDASGDTSTTNVRFYHTEKDDAAAFEVWKQWFPQDQQKVRPQQTSINSRTLVYHRLEGAYVARGQQPKKHYTLIAAVMPSQGKFVHLLFLGPAANVEAATPDFKNMIETALKEAE